MAGTYVSTTATYTITAPADKTMTVFAWKHTPIKGLSNISWAALYLWNHGNGVGGKFLGDEVGTNFNSLTRNEQLKMIEDYLKKCYLDIAKQQNIDSSIETAKTTAETNNATFFELTNGV